MPTSAWVVMGHTRCESEWPAIVTGSREDADNFMVDMNRVLDHLRNGSLSHDMVVDKLMNIGDMYANRIALNSFYTTMEAVLR